ncbi:MAG: DUF1844 domain-containing protein [Deltaproteobacteria bacterium]|jgi:hypothetical protein|nr:DUF1844 domain-containing protein [Deltaproteobacteria bacterium]
MSDITVNDRRLFNKDGEIKNTEPGAEEEVRAEARAKARAEEEPSKPLSEGGEERGGVDLNQLTPTFSSLVIALATAVMAHLGENIPEAGIEPRLDLVQAKHTIDLLGVLEKKTRGNLDETEEQLLKSLLNDLRIKYVSLLKK